MSVGKPKRVAMPVDAFEEAIQASEPRELPGKNGVRKKGAWRKPVKSDELDKLAASLPPTANRIDRVAVIADHMRQLTYRSAHVAVYAKDWGMTEESVRSLTGEAHRRVCSEVSDPSRATATVVVVLEAALMRAYEQDDLRAIGDLSRTWATIVGAVAPARVQVTALVADLGKLSADDLRSRAAELAQAVERRLALAAAEPLSGGQAGELTADLQAELVSGQRGCG